MNILASLAPIALYLVVLKAMDAFSFARWHRLTKCFLWGVVSVGIVLCTSWAWRTMHHGVAWQQLLISPLIEETVKALPLLVFIARRRLVFLAEALIYGQMIGGGFATAENILYLTANPDMLIGTALVRGLSTSMLHMGCTSLALALAVSFSDFSQKRKGLGISVGFGLDLGVGVGIHAAYNMQMLPPLVQLVCVVVGFFVLFMILSWVNDRRVAQWLDLSLNDDITLIAALKEDRFIDTPAGQYLLSIRERFEPLVFFDLCAYLSLYLKLLVAAKSQVMLREAGLDTNPSTEERQSWREQYAELQALSSRIPRMGFILLRPIVNASATDRWAIRNLTSNV